MGLIETHSHTTRSDGFSHPEEVVDAARLVPGLTHIAVTDHDSLDGARQAAAYAGALDRAPVVVIGEEVSTLHGHVLGLGIEELVPPGRSAAWTVDAIHEQGGIAIAAHPFWRPWSELRAGVDPMGVGMLIEEVPFDAVEVFNGMPLLRYHNRRAAQVVERLGLVGTGGSDAHVAEGVGAVTTSFEGDSFEDFRRDLAEARLALHRRRVLARSALAIGIHFARGRRGRFQKRVAGAD